MQRLFPDPGEISVDDAYDGLDLGAAAESQRPRVAVNMVATVDGRARLGPNTARLGGPVDQALFMRLREQVDCVMAGTRTIAAENYKGPASRPETRERRERRGLRPRPLFATVSRGGDIAWRTPLFQDPDLETVVFSEASLDLGEARAGVTQVRETDPAAVLGFLRERYDVRSLLLEGGPTLNGVFFGAGLVDELFLTVAPVLAGTGGAGADGALPIVAGALPDVSALTLVSVLVDEGHLFLRYRVV